MRHVGVWSVGCEGRSGAAPLPMCGGARKAEQLKNNSEGEHVQGR